MLMENEFHWNITLLKIIKGFCSCEKKGLLFIAEHILHFRTFLLNGGCFICQQLKKKSNQHIFKAGTFKDITMRWYTHILWLFSFFFFFVILLQEKATNMSNKFKRQMKRHKCNLKVFNKNQMYMFLTWSTHSIYYIVCYGEAVVGSIARLTKI